MCQDIVDRVMRSMADSAVLHNFQNKSGDSTLMELSTRVTFSVMQVYKGRSISLVTYRPITCRLFFFVRSMCLVEVLKVHTYFVVSMQFKF